MTYKICKRCKEKKPIKRYHSAGWKNGKQYRRNVCCDCYAIVKKKYRDDKKDWYFQMKKNMACDKCGYSKLTHPKNFCFKALEFHHHNRDKEFTVSGAVYKGFSREKIVGEIKKCTVLCARCHVEEHNKLN